MTRPDYSSLINDKILQERSRLLILSYLAGSESMSGSFMELQKSLDISRGNLSVQIKTLSEAKYVTIKKQFKDNKSLTTIFITKKGILSLKKYLEEMDKIINTIKSD